MPDLTNALFTERTQTVTDTLQNLVEALVETIIAAKGINMKFHIKAHGFGMYIQQTHIGTMVRCPHTFGLTVYVYTWSPELKVCPQRCFN